jgi:hypothetical protein
MLTIPPHPTGVAAIDLAAQFPYLVGVALAHLLEADAIVHADPSGHYPAVDALHRAAYVHLEHALREHPDGHLWTGTRTHVDRLLGFCEVGLLYEVLRILVGKTSYGHALTARSIRNALEAMDERKMKR